MVMDGRVVAGHDQTLFVNVHDVDVMSVERVSASVVTTSSVVPLAARPADVDDSVDNRQEWVHVMSGDQHGDLLLGGDPSHQLDNLLFAADVEVGQGLIEQKKTGTTDQRHQRSGPAVAHHREVPHPGVGEPGGVDGFISSISAFWFAVRRGNPNR